MIKFGQLDEIRAFSRVHFITSDTVNLQNIRSMYLKHFIFFNLYEHTVKEIYKYGKRLAISQHVNVFEKSHKNSV